MIKIILKSLAFGIVTGAILMQVSIWGSGYRFIEFIEPIIMPSGKFFILNWVIYSGLFLAVFLTLQYVKNKLLKIILIFIIIMLFLGAVGMFNNIRFLLLGIF